MDSPEPMLISHSHSPLLSLPLELIIKILGLDVIDLRSLLSCRKVCRLLRDTVDNNAALQYKIELIVANMEDGPSSILESFPNTASRLAALKQHQSAWRRLEWSDAQHIPMVVGTVWELYGGVLVQAREQDSILCFKQLPSRVKKIEYREWEIDVSAYDIRDFTFDPSQDLLAVIAHPRVVDSLQNATLFNSVQLLSCTTGKPHPLVRDQTTLTHETDIRTARLSFNIQICGELVAVMYISHGTADPELVVWRWKTGEKIMNMYGLAMSSFAFLSERHIIVATLDDISSEAAQPAIIAIDITRMNSRRTSIDSAQYLCSFRYPAVRTYVHAVDLSIRSDPSPIWQPNAAAASSNAVPFTTQRHSRLFVLTLAVITGEHISTHTLLVPSTTLTSQLGHLPSDKVRCAIAWEDWGPGGSRMIRALPVSSVWVCYVFGLKFVILRRPGPLLVENNRRKIIEVYDFNQLAMRRDASSLPRDDTDRDVELVVGPTTLTRDPVFENYVRTSLPYRIMRRQIPSVGERSFAYDAVMCTEDNLVVVDSDISTRQFLLLSF